MDKYMECFHNQDEVMENIMLFSPMPVLQAIQDSFTESMLADMHAEDAEIFGKSVPVHSGRKLSAKQRRAARRVQNKHYKQSDRKHGKGVFSYKYKENGVLKTQILPDNMRSKSAWSKACHEWGDPDRLKGRIPRTQSVNVHKDTKPVPEQEPTYVGFYGTLEVRKGINVTMEWSLPEAVQGEPV